MAIKYQEDWNYKNKLVYEALELFEVGPMHKWMNLFCTLLDFNFNVVDSEYNQYYKWLIIYENFR